MLGVRIVRPMRMDERSESKASYSQDHIHQYSWNRILSTILGTKHREVTRKPDIAEYTFAM